MPAIMTRGGKLVWAALLAAATLSAAASKKEASLGDLSFMAGCWRTTIQGDQAATLFALENSDAGQRALGGDGTLVIEERYTAKSHKMILGMSTTTSADAQASRTFYVIDGGDDGIRYRPFGRNGPLPSFAVVRTTKTLAVFENPANDRLRRISYEKRGVDLQFTLESAQGVFAQVLLKPMPCRHDRPMHFAFEWGWYGHGVGQLDSPSGITVFRDEFGVDRLVLSDSNNDRLRIYTASGMFNEKWGHHGQGPSEFATPLGVGVLPSMDVVVADSRNDRIQITSGSPPDLKGHTGVFRLAFGKHGTGPGEFDRPVGVAVDGAANIWVTDSGNGRVQRFDSRGNFLSAFGGSGAGEAAMREPAGIAIDDRGIVYVADSGNRRVVVFTSNGTVIRQFLGSPERPLVRPRGVAVDRARRVYVADAGTHSVEIFSDTGEWIGGFGREGGTEGELRRPESVAVSIDGDVFVADTGNHRIQVFRPGAAR